uniref:ribosomal protein L22 n=1 Tax=Flexiglena variabilis TaxID=2743688 RepID=UPI0023AA2D10|nr:ribosomal protein L22 [Flexiglena variabilis]WCH63476.1 ribosomal protein L22 [Flexiglena variabilis]
MKDSKILEAKAFSRYVRISPLKVRRVLDQVRGRSYNEALLILQFLPNKSSNIILKVLQSAVSNAKKNLGFLESSIFISEARVDEGPVLKRFRPHAQGRGFPIKKSMSHIIRAICIL